jgi:histidyl-tRNA synthetase
MSNCKHPIVKGTRDLYGDALRNRDFIIQTIGSVFRKYNFEPLETPAFEYLNLLTSKYGDEGDKLLYKVLNSGNFMQNVDMSLPITPQISEKGLRYDLTVPMMRYVAMYHNELSFPWKRYQIQPVWRADRPQKGRYREFYQCDLDIVGNKSILCEAELLTIAYESLVALQICDFNIYVNHIDIFLGFLEIYGEAERFRELFTIVDKLDKVGEEVIYEEMKSKNFPHEIIENIKKLLKLQNRPNRDIIEALYLLLEDSKRACNGIAEIDRLLHYTSKLGVKEDYIKINPILARGLSYYTGTIFEAKIADGSIGSIVGGGRYDDMLSNNFNIKSSSNFIDTAVGLSFGIDRIYSLLSDRGMFNVSTNLTSKILIAPMDEMFETQALELATTLRSHQIIVDLISGIIKLKKHLEYANKKNIAYVVIIGADEVAQNKFSIKNMITGTQEMCTLHQIIELLK